MPRPLFDTSAAMPRRYKTDNLFAFRRRMWYHNIKEQIQRAARRESDIEDKKNRPKNYLETIYILTKRNGSVRSIDIAAELEFSKPSVSIAMKNLRENGYIKS